MIASSNSRPQRLAWLEGIRIFAAVMILLYHAQLLFTDYAYTPQPTGLVDNLHQIAVANDRLNQPGFFALFSTPVWFGFQFVDVFVLISGFVSVLSLRGKALEPGSFLKRRIMRILMPFWTIAWFAYPVLWAIGEATNSYFPDLWHVFAGTTFPLLWSFDGSLLLPTSGPWWFVPLILSFVLVFPFLWYLLRRWGARNLLLVSLLLTVCYRMLAVYQFGGHPTYVDLNTPTGWLPFLTFVSKLSTFVLGMVLAQAYFRGRGPLFWRADHVLAIGGSLYIAGFLCQFSRLGWVFADLLLPVGLTACCMVLFRRLEAIDPLKPILVMLGVHSYSYFLIHNFVVDRTINLVVGHNVLLYYGLLPVMVVGTLILSIMADYTTPLIRRLIIGALRDVDYVLTTSPEQQIRIWNPKVGDRVRYQGESGWTVLKVEQLLDDKELYLCKISDGEWTIWLSEDELEPDSSSPANSNEHTRVNSTRF